MPPRIIYDFASQFSNLYRERLPYEFHAHTTGIHLCAFDRLFKGARIRESRSKMYLALRHSFDIQDLSVEQLQYIPKVVRMYDDYIDYVRQAF